MGKLWIDSDVLMQAANGVLSIEIAPPLWSFFDEQAKLGKICICRAVYKEILRRDDELSKWIKPRKNTRLCSAEPPRNVQQQYNKIADHIVEKYKPKKAAKVDDFLTGADIWVIAHHFATVGQSWPMKQG